MTNTHKQYEARIAKIIELVQKKMPKLAYHNKRHAIDVWNIGRQYASMENITLWDKLVLEPALLLHDIEFGKENHEERSAEFATKYLPLIGYSKKQSEKAGEIILASKFPYIDYPGNILEAIMRDSDLDNLGREDFFKKGDALRQELDIEGEDWDRMQLGFLRSHRYYTESARRLRESEKQKNIEILENKILGLL